MKCNCFKFCNICNILYRLTKHKVSNQKFPSQLKSTNAFMKTVVDGFSADKMEDDAKVSPLREIMHPIEPQIRMVTGSKQPKCTDEPRSGVRESAVALATVSTKSQSYMQTDLLSSNPLNSNFTLNRHREKLQWVVWATTSIDYFLVL